MVDTHDVRQTPDAGQHHGYGIKSTGMAGELKNLPLVFNSYNYLLV